MQDRLSNLSSSKDEFDLASPPYQDALKKAGYKEKLKFEKPVPNTNQKSKNRSRNCIWFNPPYSLAVSTNLTKLYADIIKKAFPKNHLYLNKLFNKNNLKMSYSCAPNMDKIVSTHNMKLLDIKDVNQPQPKTCSCSAADKINCPLDNVCLSTEIVYQADVSSTDGATKHYIGLTEPTFKKRLYNHRKSFKNREYEHETTLSTYIWQLKDKNIGYSIKWKLLKQSRAYSPITQKCHLCLDEKLLILKNYTNPAFLNKSSELFGKCRHRLKHLLKKAWWILMQPSSLI